MAGNTKEDFSANSFSFDAFADQIQQRRYLAVFVQLGTPKSWYSISWRWKMTCGVHERSLV